MAFQKPHWLGTEPLTLEPLRHTLRFESYHLGKARTMYLWIPGAPPLHTPQTTEETEVPRYTAVSGRNNTQGELIKGLRGKMERGPIKHWGGRADLRAAG